MPGPRNSLYKQKRRTKRYQKQFPIFFNFLGFKRKGLILNISESGIFIECHTLPADGTLIDISLATDQSKTIELKGKVVWNRNGLLSVFHTAKPRGIGVDIIDIDHAFSQLIDHLQENETSSDHIKLGASLAGKGNLNRIIYKSTREFLNDYCEDLSKGGLYLASNHMLTIGQEIPIELCIGPNNSVQIEGTVAYNLAEDQAQFLGKGSQLGLQFVDLSSRSIQVLQSFIAQQPMYKTIQDSFQFPILSSGSLEQQLFPHILIQIARNKYTGTLRINNFNDAFALIFKKGMLVHVDEMKPRTTFLDFIFAKTSLQAFQKRALTTEINVREAVSADASVKDLILRNEYFSEKEVNKLWRHFQLNKLLMYFATFEGTFTFDSASKDEHIAFEQTNDLWKAIYIGLHQCYGSTLIRSLLPKNVMSHIKTFNQYDMLPTDFKKRLAAIQDLSDSQPLNPSDWPLIFVIYSLLAQSK